jgi:hypothetical protein
MSHVPGTEFLDKGFEPYRDRENTRSFIQSENWVLRVDSLIAGLQEILSMCPSKSVRD